MDFNFDPIRLCGLGPLAGLLVLATWRDLASFRIPNAIVASGLAIALLFHALAEPGYGLLGAAPGGAGLRHALAGAGVGLVAMLPLYLIGAAGAGDAKLMAMVGAFVGPTDAVGASLGAFLAGMLMALFAMARPGVGANAVRNLRLISWILAARFAGETGPRFDPRTQTAARLPYSVAIAANVLT
jgi:prepilin peptidase CpaA